MISNQSVPSEQSNMPGSPNSLKSLEHLDETNTNNAHELVLVGGGPRSVIQINAEIVFMLMYRDHFRQLQDLGAKYDISTTVIEKRDRMGPGSPYDEGQTGMMNTGVEDDVQFPIALPKGSEAMSMMLHFLSYKKRFESYLGTDFESYINKVKKVNVPGAIMFRNSVGPDSFSKEGALDHKVAYMMRGNSGDEEEKTFECVSDLAKRFLPFYKLNVNTSSQVLGVKMPAAGKPLVNAEIAGEAMPQMIEADQVRLNTGTVLKNPVSDPNVRSLMFCQAMNVNHFRTYCSDRHLLDKDGLLKSGLRIISGGMGLSGLDQITVLDGVMNLFEEDDSQLLGYKVTSQAKARYQNAITLIARTAGRTVLPRLGFTNEWRQNAPIIAFTEHLHALSLHNYGEEAFRIWYDVLTASVARSMGMTPEEVTQGKLPVKISLKQQYEATLKFLHFRRLAGDQEKEGNMKAKQEYLDEAQRSIFGAWRQATTAFLFGYGLENDVQAAKKRMEKMSPITWKGRQSWLYARTMVSSITDPKFANKACNMQYYENWKNAYRYIASSPPEIHSMIHLLVDAGIASYEPAKYEQVTYDETFGRLDLRGSLHDVFIVSPTFDSSEDPVASSLSQFMKPFDSSNPHFGTVGKFRKYQDRSGKSVPIESNGVAGLGFNLKNGGLRSRVGTFAIDLNDRSSATGVSSSFTLRRMAVVHMKAAGIEDAEEKMEALYEKNKASLKDYDREVKKFESYFTEINEIWSFLKAIERIAGDDAEKYSKLYDEGLTNKGRVQMMERARKSPKNMDVKSAKMYFEEVQNLPAFKPVSRDGFYERSIDTTDEEDAKMYNEALQLAKKQLRTTSH